MKNYIGQALFYSIISTLWLASKIRNITMEGVLGIFVVVFALLVLLFTVGSTNTTSRGQKTFAASNRRKPVGISQKADFSSPQPGFLKYDFEPDKNESLEDDDANRKVFDEYPSTSDAAKGKKQRHDLIQSIHQLEVERGKLASHGAFVNSLLMLQILIAIHYNENSLPTQPWALYQKIVDILFPLDETATAPASEMRRLTSKGQTISHAMLLLLAYQIHKAGTDGLTKNELNDRQDFNEQEIKDLLNKLDKKDVLLTNHNGRYQFLHPALQGFLAGLYLASLAHDPDQVIEHIGNDLTLSRWREPILMMFRHLDAQQSDWMDALLLRMAGADEASAQRARPSLDMQLAGAELAATATLARADQPFTVTEALIQRLERLKQQAENESWNPRLHAQAMKALDYLGYSLDDAHVFIPIPNSPEPKFLIAKYPLTYAQYERFLTPENFANKDLWTGFPKYDENSREIPGETWGDEAWDWLQGIFQEANDPTVLKDDNERSAHVKNGMLLPYEPNSPNSPVVDISWFEACAYCKWLSQQPNSPEALSLPSDFSLHPSSFRLPTEAEWVQAAGGDANHRFAWGELTDPQEIIRFAHTQESNYGLSIPVWMYPKGASQPHKIFGMSGNIYERCINFFGTDRENLAMRGGSAISKLEDARISHRTSDSPYYEDSFYGFRLVAVPND